MKYASLAFSLLVVSCTVGPTVPRMVVALLNANDRYCLETA
jgi:hypothetical protein